MISPEDNGSVSTDSGQAMGSGWVDDARGAHLFPIRVYYEDTDAGGIVYYANYLKFAERARTEMLRLLGHDQADLIEDAGIAFIVRQCLIDYHAPARLDDVVMVSTRMTELGSASLRLHQTLLRGDTLLADVRIRVACVSRKGMPARMPAELRERFAALPQTPQDDAVKTTKRP